MSARNHSPVIAFSGPSALRTLALLLAAGPVLCSAGVWAEIVDAFVPLHYGTFGGLPVKILWVLGGFTPGILAVSGFSIWWLRRRRHSPGEYSSGSRRAGESSARLVQPAGLEAGTRSR